MNELELETFLRDTGRNLPEGSVHDDTMRYMHSLLSESPPARSLETGCGRTTALFAAMSKQHTVFCLEQSPNLRHFARTANVDWQYGPTQRTLPTYKFTAPLDFVLIDGPHAYPFPELEYYFIYPHLREGALLAIDDVHIPTIHNLYAFLRREQMFDFVRRIDNTAFFRRNSSPLFDPYADGWWLQRYNVENIDRYKPPIIRLKCWVRRLFERRSPIVQE